MGLNLKKLGSKLYDQVNPFDNGRTFKQRTPTNNRSLLSQATHNGATNAIGDTFVKPVVQIAPNVSNQIYNRVVAPIGHLPRQDLRNQALSPIVGNVSKFSGATGDIPQTLSSIANTALILGTGGLAKGAEATAARMLPKVTPKLVTKTVANTATGAGVGGGFGGSSYLGNTAHPTISGFGKAAGTGALVGGGLGAGGTLAAPLVKGGAKVAVKTAKSAKPLNEKGSVQLPGLSGTAAARPPIALKAPKAPRVSVAKDLAPSTEKVSTFDVLGRSSEGVLNQIDSRLGTGVAQRREIGETGAALAKSQLKVANKLSKDEGTNLARVLKGTEKPLNENVRIAADEARLELKKVHALAVREGVQIPGKIEKYFPQIHNPKTFEKGTNQNEAAIQHLMGSGQAKTREEAIDYLRKFRDTTKTSPYQNLTKSRTLDLPGYAENVSALHQYLDRAYATIAHAHVFGPKEERLNRIFSEIQQSGGDYNRAVKSYQQASGLVRGSEKGEKASRIATNIQGTTKLGLSAVGNITQRANNAIVGGLGRTVKAQGRGLFSQADKDFVEKTGVTSEQVAHEALFGEQGLSQKFRKLTAPFFEPVEKGNRANGALVGRDQAIDLAKKAAGGNAKAAQKLQRDFGITKYKNGLSEADQIKAARKFVERTQFRTGSQDLPGWASAPMGRVISQFKRYPYKQAQFLKREVIDELRRGNTMPLIRLLGIGAPVGIGASALSDKIRGSNFNQTPIEKGLNYVNDATGANIVTSLAQSLYPSSKDANGYVTKVTKALSGPTISDGIKAVEAAFDAAHGKGDNAARLALSHVPVVGTPISNRVLPYSSTSKPVTKDNLANASLADIKAQDSKEKAAFEKTNKGGGYGLTKTESGRYIYQIDNEVKTATDLKKAREAIALDAFDKSGEAERTVGDKHYYRDQNGDAKKEFQFKHEFDLADSQNSLDMDVAKDAGDYGAWTESANNQLDALQKVRDRWNQTGQKDEVNKTDKKIFDLKKQMAKYSGYGGAFTKGGGSGGAAKTVGSAYKYAVSRRSGGSIANPKVTVAKSSSTPRSSSGGGAKPKVSLKRSKV